MIYYVGVVFFGEGGGAARDGKGLGTTCMDYSEN